MLLCLMDNFLKRGVIMFVNNNGLFNMRWASKLYKYQIYNVNVLIFIKNV